MRFILFTIFLYFPNLCISANDNGNGGKPDWVSLCDEHGSNSECFVSKLANKHKNSQNNSNNNNEAPAAVENDEEYWNYLVEKYLVSGRSNPAYIHEQSTNLEIVSDTDNNELVFFTRDTHAAHPSFAKIYFVTHGQGTKVETSAFTLSNTNQYQKFIKGDILPLRYELTREILKN